MATAQLKGSADIQYTPLGGMLTTHLLAVPLVISPAAEFVSRRRPRLFSAWSADLTAREVFKIGTPVDEIEALLRRDNEPDKVRTMLSEALENDVTLTYRPTGGGGTTYPAKLVQVAGGAEGEVVLNLDPHQFGKAEWNARLLLRRVDGNDFEGLLS